MRKHYEAIAPWRADIDFPLKRKSRIIEGEPFFRQRESDGPPNSETDIDIITVKGRKALYKLNPVTGKKHQLRVHMYALGLAIDNDRMYPPVPDTPGDDFNLPLQLLAKGIAFTDPITGQDRAFESQLKLQNLGTA
jgi:tRNA pseudouridine32 synthase/23S rRNA pseudouridine746 synthase